MVEEERVRAAVKSVHIRKLKARLSVKKDCGKYYLGSLWGG